MDVHCSSCGEPWDVYHLRNDAIHETDLGEMEIDAWKQLPVGERLAPYYREKFKAVGYEFGASVIDVWRCPCCPKDAKPDPTRTKMKAVLADMLGDDEDGLVASLEELGL